MPVPDFSPGEVLTAAAMDQVGLWKVGEFTASGTSRALVCDNIFTSTYRHYRIVIELRASAQLNGCYFQYLDSAGATVTSGYFQSAYGQDYAGGTTGFLTTLTSGTLQSVGFIPNDTLGPQSLMASMDVYSPYLTTSAVAVNGQHQGISSGAYFFGGQFMGNLSTTATMRGLRFDNGAGVNLKGLVTVYGYR